VFYQTKANFHDLVMTKLVIQLSVNIITYDAANRLGTTKNVNCEAFVPVSIGTKSVKIHQETTQKLWSKTKGHLFYEPALRHSLRSSFAET